MEYMQGFITLDRKILDWEWWDDHNTSRLFIYLLLNANWKNGKWHGIEIKRGQRLTSRNSLAKGTRLSVQQIRTSLKRLEGTGEISLKSTKQYTIITIVKYDTYQTDIREANPRLTHDQPTANPQLTTNEQREQGKKVKNINTFVPTAVETRLSDFLKNRILENNPKAIIKNGVGWCKAVRLMLSRDKRTEKEIEEVIEFSQDDEFWRSNILSMDKLRQQFDKLTLKMGGHDDERFNF